MTELSDINKRINDECCAETINKLKDTNLINIYKECGSVKTSIVGLTEILEKHGIDKNKSELIVNDYLLKLIPPGTKGVIKGNMFNKIIQEYVENLKLDKTKFKICFETKCDFIQDLEKPDWFIQDIDSKKILIEIVRTHGFLLGWGRTIK